MEFTHARQVTPRNLDLQAPSEIAGIQADWSSTCGTMAGGETQGRNAPHARRLRALRAVMGYSESQQAFAKFLGLSHQRYNNFENGTPLSISAAEIICRKAQGVTLDWLYRAIPDGLPVKLARDLQTALDAIQPLDDASPIKSGKTSPRGSKRRGGPSPSKKPSTS